MSQDESLSSLPPILEQAIRDLVDKHKPVRRENMDCPDSNPNCILLGQEVIGHTCFCVYECEHGLELRLCL